MFCPHCNAPNAPDARFCGACGKATSSTEPVSNPSLGEAPQLIGRVIAGRYRIQEKLGEGGMGAVFRAEQISLKRACAVKLLRPDLSATPMLQGRFNTEAAAVAKLKHPNTVHVYDFGHDSDGTLFIAMEYVEGRSLRKLIQSEAPLPLRRGLKIAAQVAASLTDAHAKAIVHRDLKPDNVMLHDAGKDRDIVTVLDFGIAKLRDDGRATQHMTQAGDMLGTPQYMAPEQIRAEDIDGRTDVYALGCMLYEMFTGRLPFEAPTVMALLSKHLLEQPVPPSQRRPDLQLPPSIDELIMTAMAKEPGHRPPTMEACGERIAAMLAVLPSATPAAMSAVVGVPQVAPTMPSGAGQFAALPAPSYGAPVAGFSPPPFAPPSAPPAGYAPGPTPPPQPPAAAYAPSAPYAAPAAPYPYPAAPAPAGTPPTPTQSPFAIAPAPSGSSRTLLIVLALILVGGGGVAAYHFATKKSDPSVVGPGSDRKPDGDRAGALDAGPRPDDDSDDEPDQPDPSTPESSDDPWGASGGPGNAPVPSPTLPAGGPSDSPMTSSVMPAGAKLIAPAGFVHQEEATAQALVNPHTQVAVMMFAVPGVETDPDALARNWATTTKVKFEGKADFVSHGASRPVLGFTGKNGATPIRQAIVLFFGDSYRLAVLVAAPTKVADGAQFGDWLLQLLEHNVVLPGS